MDTPGLAKARALCVETNTTHQAEAKTAMTSAKDDHTEREAMSLMARQVAEGSRTLGLHIKQHDDITEEARKWAQEVIAEGRRRLEETHGQATADIVANLRQTASELAKGNEELLQRMEAGIKAAEEAIDSGSQLLLKEHGTALEKAASQFQTLLEQQAASNQKLHEEQQEELRQERQRQLEQHQQLRDETVALMKTEMDVTLERAAKANQEALEQVATEVNQENKANTDKAVAAMDQRWSAFTKTIIGIAITSSTVAVALTAVLVTLI